MNTDHETWWRGRAATASAVLLAASFAAAAPAADDPGVFADGFEDGTTCAWTLPSSCDLMASFAFSAPDGSAWPAPWTALGGVALAEVTGGEARLRPSASGYSLARMGIPDGARDVEVTFTARLEDATTQGVGLYVRQNGGYLQATAPTGAGYAVFLEGTFRGQPGIGIWKEVDGTEIEVLHASPVSPVTGTPYRVRFRVRQEEPGATRLQARIWQANDPEPDTWDLDLLDATPSLQGVGGGVAVDSWSVLTSEPILGSTIVDDLEVRAIPGSAP